MEIIKILEKIKSEMIDDVMSGEFDNVTIFATAQIEKINVEIGKLHTEFGHKE